MDTLEDIKAELRRLKPEIESRYPLRLVSIFGSFVRGEQTADSDVDILAEKTGPHLTLFDIIGAEQDLEKRIKRRIDLIMTDELRERIKSRVLAEAVGL
jgi:uncharacterized protein